MHETLSGEVEKKTENKIISKVVCGDCIEELKKLNNDSVDLIVTSPPYWSFKDYSAGEKDIGKDQPLGDYLTQMHMVFAECKRVLKDNCYMCVIIRDMTRKRVCYPLHCYMIQLAENLEFTLEDIKYVLLLSHAHYDFILVFRKGEPRFSGKMKDKYDEPFWDLRKFREKVDHPASFITAIPDILIKKYSEKGEIVLDPFAGSLSTAIASANNQRSYLMIELSEKYINLGKERLKRRVKNLRAFG